MSDCSHEWFENADYSVTCGKCGVNHEDIETLLNLREDRISDLEEAERILLSMVWQHFLLRDDGWFMGGAISSNEEAADYLVERGLLVKHPKMERYKFKEQEG